MRPNFSAPRRGPCRWMAWALVASGVLSALLAGCGRGCDGGVESFAGIVPADAVASLRFPTPRVIHAPMHGFLDGLGDAQGVYDFVEGRFGVDLSSLDGVESSGLDPDGEVYIWWASGALSLAAKTSHRERFDALLEARLRGSGFGAPAPAAEGERKLRVAERGADAALAWGHERNIIVMCQAANAALARAGVASALARDPEAASLFDSARYQQALSGLEGEGAAVRIYADLEAARQSEAADQVRGGGGAWGSAVDPVLDSAATIGVVVTLAEDQLVARMAVRPLGGGFDWLAPWLASAASPPDFGSVVPRDAALFARVHLDPAPALRVPAFLLSAAVPKGVLGRVHPLLADVDVVSEVLPSLLGDAAIAVFGLVEGATVDRLATARSLADATPLLDGAAMVRLREPTRVWAALAAVVGPLAQSRGYTLEEIPGVAGGPPGVRAQHPKSGEVLGAFVAGDLLVATSGAQGYLDARAALEGRATPLAKRAESLALQAVVRGEPLVAGAYVSFYRLGRELGERGAPPFFLRLLDSIFEAGFKVEYREGAVWVDMEVRQ